jgi:sugar/nucleoside kinase (ribokinase family)
MSEQFGLLCIGNAIVDILSPVSDELIQSQEPFGMRRNAMNLINPQRAQDIYALMGQTTEMSGGSACNTAACFGSLGGKGAFIGMTGDDQFGKIFRHDVTSQGVHYTTPPVTGKPTSQCLILVTPDGHRTMNIFFDGTAYLRPEAIDETVVARSDIVYLEGFLFDKEEAREALYKAADFAKKYGKKTALTLSDSFCVDRFRAEFLKMTRDRADILFANEQELISLYETDNLETAIKKARNDCPFVAVTMGPHGSKIFTEHESVEVAAEPTKVVDTTGAGDSYAGGVLYGLTQNMPLSQCARLGSIAAAEVISHFGPRPLVPLSSLIPADMMAA